MKSSAETSKELGAAVRHWKAARTASERERAYREAEAAAQPILCNEARIFARDRRNDQDDLMQAGRLALWEAMATYDASKSQPCTYFSRAVRNALISHVRVGRNRQNAESLSVFDGAGDEFEVEAGSEDNVAAWEAAQIGTVNIEQMIEMLRSPNQRDVCRLRYVEGIETYAEIAARLGCAEKHAENYHTSAVSRWRTAARRGVLPVQANEVTSTRRTPSP